MASNFDFAEFMKEQSITEMFTEFANVLTGDSVEEINEGVEKFKKKHRIDSTPAPVEPFTFPLSERTYEAVVKRCIDEGRNIKKVILIQGDKFYAARELEANPELQVWEEISSPSTVDVHQEASNLSFLDSAKRQVDWQTTISNLADMCRIKLYSEGMMHACLLRFVNHYEPSQTEYLKKKSSDEIAQFLLALNSQVDRISHHKARLLSSMRQPDESLSAALFKVKNVAELVYSSGDEARRVENAGLINRILINAIISFVRDELAVPLQAQVYKDSMANRLRDYTEYLRYAMLAEIRSNVVPTVPLKYNRKIPTHIQSVMALNSITVPDIHPCQTVPKRRFPPKSMENYFVRDVRSTDVLPAWIGQFGDGPGRDIAGVIPPYIDLARSPSPEKVPGPNLPTPHVSQTEEEIADEISKLAISSKVSKEAKSIRESFPSLVDVAGPSKQLGSQVDEKSTVDLSSIVSKQPKEMAEQVYTDVMNMLFQNLKVPLMTAPRTDSKNRKNETDKDGHQRDRSRSRDAGKSSDKNRQISKDYDRSRQSGRQPDYNKRQSLSRDRQGGRQRDNSRSYSRDRRPDQRDRRPDSRDRRRDSRDSRPDSRSRRENRYNKPVNPRDFSKSPQRRDISRDRSKESRRISRQDEMLKKNYPEMKRGLNCSHDYNPLTMKHCTKCSNKFSHHEFECKQYYTYSSTRCSQCDKYYHSFQYCKDAAKYPPYEKDDYKKSNPN